MAKDPATGAMRPVTLYPKNVKNVGGITTIQLGRPNFHKMYVCSTKLVTSAV